MTTFKADRPREPDFKRVYQCANEMLVRSSVITEFPFKVKELVKEQADISFCTYKKAQKKYHQDIRQFGSDSAVLMEMQGAHIIFYNQDEVIYRIRFSIMHEFGHYVLKHKLNLTREDGLYDVQEIEANCFAAQILMPEQLLRECRKRGKPTSVDFIVESFGVSSEAADKRRNTLANTVVEWRSREKSMYDDIILNKYRMLLDTIAPIPRQYSYSFEDDFQREQERNGWMDTRSRWR